MITSSPLLKRQRVDPSEIAADATRFSEIVRDMEENGGELIPIDHWIVPYHKDGRSGEVGEGDRSPFSEEGFQQHFSSMDKLMEPWVGAENLHLLDQEHIERYGRLLSQYDPLDLWRANVLDPQVASRLLSSDLGSIMDLNLIWSFVSRPLKNMTFIVEVGGGYGRLAEAALNVFGDSVRYVMVDSVPASLQYAHEYMSRACPERSIGSFYSGDDLDLDRYDCYIVPSWHFERLNSYRYDVCVNIESFQEMGQRHVDHYLQMFDRISSAGALVYLSNSREYVFKGQWNYPDTWQKLFSYNTPRSWTDDHPTEIFRRSEGGDFEAANRMIDLFFRHPDFRASLRRSLRTTRALALRSASRTAQKMVKRIGLGASPRPSG